MHRLALGVVVAAITFAFPIRRMEPVSSYLRLLTSKGWRPVPQDVVPNGAIRLPSFLNNVDERQNRWGD